PLNPFPFLYIPQFSRFTLLVYLTLSQEGASGTSAPSRTGRERKAPGARSGDMPPDDSLAC
ncbi:hypothetical protein, partial [Pseudomonas aeruginosa]